MVGTGRWQDRREGDGRDDRQMVDGAQMFSLLTIREHPLHVFVLCCSHHGQHAPQDRIEKWYHCLSWFVCVGGREDRLMQRWKQRQKMVNSGHCCVGSHLLSIPAMIKQPTVYISIVPRVSFVQDEPRYKAMSIYGQKMSVPWRQDGFNQDCVRTGGQSEIV